MENAITPAARSAAITCAARSNAVQSPQVVCACGLQPKVYNTATEPRDLPCDHRARNDAPPSRRT